MVVEHKHRIGFKGTILIEPKPFEPTKHQYDRDVAAVYAFLQRYGLTKEVKVNIEVNHATLAGLDFEHEVAAARAYGIFGSIDMNRGDPRNGWDTDQFPNNAQELVPAMAQIVEDGGFDQRWLQFRREAAAPVGRAGRPVSGAHRWYRHTGTRAARGGGCREQRGSGATQTGALSRLGQRSRPAHRKGELSLEQLADLATEKGLDPAPRSGRQELAESLIARRCRY